MTDGNYVRYHSRDDTLSVLLNLIRSQCVVAVVKCLKVLATCRVGIRVAGQPGVWPCSRSTGIRPAHWMCVWSCNRLWWIWSASRNERQTVASEQSLDVPSVWVRFTLQGWNSIQESSVSHGDWDCLIPLPHRVTRVTLWLSKMMIGWRFYHCE
jgi:hypothetical protein